MVSNWLIIRYAEHADTDLLDGLDGVLAECFARFERFPQSARGAHRGDQRGFVVDVAGRRCLQQQQDLRGSGVARAANAGGGGFGVAAHVVVVAVERARR
jgi:hypothetical protein